MYTNVPDEQTVDIGATVFGQNTNTARPLGHNVSTAEAFPGSAVGRGEKGEARTGNNAPIGTPRCELGVGASSKMTEKNV